MPGRAWNPASTAARRVGRRRGRAALSGGLLAILAACGTAPPVATGPGNVTRIPPGNSQRDGPEANPPPNLDAVPDAVPQLEPLRIGGPNKPYEVFGRTYVPLTDDRAVTESGLASWYGKKFHGQRTASGEAYNMYAMTAAHKTLPIPSYARVRNPANGKEVIVRVNDRGPFSAGRVIDLSYTAALKLGVLGGVQPVEIQRITGDEIRSGAAFRHGPVVAAAGAAAAPVGDLDRNSTATRPPTAPVNRFGWFRNRGRDAAPTAIAATTAPGPGDVVVPSPAVPGTGGRSAGGGESGVVDLGAAAATDDAPGAEGSSGYPAANGGSATSATALLPATPPAPATLPATSPPSPSAASSPPAPASSPPPAPGPEPRMEQGRADTTAGTGFWVQIGAYRDRNGALDFQHRLVDEQPWLAPLLAVFTDRGLNKLQAGPYHSREQARTAAERIRTALQLIPTIVEKR